jgi:conjugal transfer/type IV secretion protein DotA/TraY
MAITVFTPSAQDLSLQYLYTIFGDMNGVISAYGIAPMAAGTTTVTILGTMFQMFNSIVLALGAFMVVYVTVVGVMATAHEGQFMGKKWNNMWLPIRTVLGIATLVPTSSGYSAIQIIMMWIIVQGIGAADNLWNTTLTFVASSPNHSPYAKLQVALSATSPDGTPAGLGTIGAKEQLKSIFQAVTCSESTRLTANPPFSQNILWMTTPLSAGYFCNFNSGNPACSSNDFSVSTLQKTNQISLGPNQSCGSITYCDYNTSCNTTNSNLTADQQKQTCQVCTQQIQALSTILPYFVNVADQLIQKDLDYSNYFYQSGSNPPPQFIQDYCSAKGISQQNCKAIITQTTKTGSGSSGQPPQITVSSAGLPAPYTSSPFDQSASQYVVANIYIPALKSLTQISSTGMKTCANTSSSTSTPSTTSSTPSNVDFMAIAVAEYQCDTTLPSQTPTQVLNGTSKTATDQGWLVAGSYYYTISGFIKSSITSLTPPLTYNAPDPDLLVPDNLLQSACDGHPCRTSFAAADYFLQDLAQVNSSNVNQFGTSNSSSSSSSSSSALSGPMNDATATMNATLTTTMAPAPLSSNGLGANDPVATLIILGTILLYVVEIAFVVMLAILLTLGISGNISVFALGTGFINPIGPTATLLSMLLIPAIMAFFGIVLTVGGTLSIYVPLIPFVIFTLGAIGWFTSVIEAMVAGPLVALGILSPAGQHELLGKAEPAIGFLFNIFLRPSLMIFGLVAAVLLAGTMIDLLNTTFYTVFMQIGLEHALDPVGLVLFLIAYVTLVITILNKCFAAIHIIPEKVGRWIGMQGEQYGESADGLKQALDSGGQRASGAMQSTGTKAADARVKDANRASKEGEADIKPKTPKGE